MGYRGALPGLALDGSQEREEGRVELLGALQARQVAGVRDDHLARPGQVLGQDVGDDEEVGQVRLADDDQGQRPDLVQARDGRRLPPSSR